MSEVLQANVFFVITSIAVVALTIFVCVALYYLIRILRNVRDVTDRLKRGTEQIAEDVMSMRSFVHEGVIGLVKSSFSRFTGKKSSRKGTKDTIDVEEA